MAILALRVHVVLCGFNVDCPYPIHCLLDEESVVYTHACTQAYGLASLLLNFAQQLSGEDKQLLTSMLYPPDCHHDDNPVFVLVRNDTCSFTWTGEEHIQQVHTHTHTHTHTMIIQLSKESYALCLCLCLCPHRTFLSAGRVGWWAHCAAVPSVPTPVTAVTTAPSRRPAPLPIATVGRWASATPSPQATSLRDAHYWTSSSNVQTWVQRSMLEENI